VTQDQAFEPVKTSGALDIPFFRPHLTGREVEYVSDAIARRSLAGNGPYTQRAVELLRGLTGVPAMLTTTGTDALELAVTALDLPPGEEVIVPSYTFVSTASCLLQAGLVPVFADVELDTANLDVAAMEAVIGPRTRAVIPVHYAGVAVDMSALKTLAERHGLVIVEDASHGIGGRYRGQSLGAIGEMGVFSFHQSKNVTSGEGGALLIRDTRYLAAAEVNHEIGTDRARFLRGEITQYSWIGRGSNYLMSDLLAAFLLAQLEGLATVTARRQRIWHAYEAALRPYADAGRLMLPRVPPDCDSSFHFFHFLMPTHREREALRAFLRERGIGAAVHYTALHRSTGGQRFGVQRAELPHAERVETCILRPPCYTDLTETDQQRVIDALQEFFDA